MALTVKALPQVLFRDCAEADKSFSSLKRDSVTLSGLSLF